MCVKCVWNVSYCLVVDLPYTGIVGNIYSTCICVCVLVVYMIMKVHVWLEWKHNWRLNTAYKVHVQSKCMHMVHDVHMYSTCVMDARLRAETLPFMDKFHLNARNYRYAYLSVLYNWLTPPLGVYPCLSWTSPIWMHGITTVYVPLSVQLIHPTSGYTQR